MTPKAASTLRPGTRVFWTLRTKVTTETTTAIELHACEGLIESVGGREVVVTLGNGSSRTVDCSVLRSNN